MNPNFLRWLVLATAAASVAIGCGQQTPASAGPEKTAQASPAGAAPAKGQAKQNACALFDREDIEAIAGQPLTMLHDIQEEDQSACELSAKDGTTLLTVTVHWKGGKELARIWGAGLSMAKQALNDEEVDIEELTGSDKVRGLADKAYYSDVMPSWVLKGDIMIEIIAPRFPGEQTKKAFLAVARKALSRLP